MQFSPFVNIIAYESKDIGQGQALPLQLNTISDVIDVFFL
jgi:hypothetical protein